VIGVNLYRTIQEAINNAIKYSEAKDIEVNVKKEDDQIQITIHDNGRGFDIENTNFGNGLYNMQKRIEEVKGTYSIQSELQKGTTITILLTQNQQA
jgi:signal transduction histidine kinase